MLAVTGLTGGLLLAGPQPASAANLIKNAGFETAGTDGMPYCWEKSGWGDNDFAFAHTSDAHTGAKAMKVTLTRRVMRRPQGADHRVDGVRARGDAGQAVRPVALVQVDDPRHLPHPLPARRDGGLAVLDGPQDAGHGVRLHRGHRPHPRGRRGTDRITWGVSVYGTGSVTTDDYTMEQVPDVLPPATCTGTADTCANGRWDVLPTQNPVRSMHSVVLNNGKVLLIMRLRQQRGAVQRGHVHVGGVRPGDRQLQGRPHAEGHVLLRARAAPGRARPRDERQQGLPGGRMGTAMRASRTRTSSIPSPRRTAGPTT